MTPPKETFVGAKAALNHGGRAAVCEARQHVRRPWRRRRRTKAADEAETEHSGVLPESHGVSSHMGNSIWITRTRVMYGIQLKGEE